MDKLIIPIKSDSEKKFWKMIKDNSSLRLGQLAKVIGKNPLYKLFKRIEELEKIINVQIIKKEIRLEENRPVYFYEKVAQIELKENSLLILI